MRISDWSSDVCSSDLAITEVIESERQAPTLDDLAALCGFSRRHLVRVFRNTTGRTIGQHILEMRIHRAKSLLLRRDLLVKQVAFQCGYSSSAAFAAAFRQTHGQSPQEFRDHVTPLHTGRTSCRERGVKYV